MNLPAPYLIAAFFLAFLLFGLALHRHQQGKRRANLLRLAKQFGFEVVEPTPFLGLLSRSLTSVGGRYRGQAVCFFTYATETGESTQQWSAVGADIPHNQDRELGVYPRNKFIGWPQQVYKRPDPAKMHREMEAMREEGRVFSVKIKWGGFGPRAISCDDDNFNRAFVIKTNDENFAKAVLAWEIRARLLKEQEQGPRFQLTLNEGQVQLSQRRDLSIAADADRLAAMLDFLCDVAALANAYDSAEHPQSNR